MILVTGGAGYIGSHTCVELLNAGYDVLVVDNLCNSSAMSLDRVAMITGRKPAFVEADVCDEQAMERVFSENSIECVIHFAGLKAVGESVSQPLRYYSNNLNSTMTLVKVMQRHGVHNIVFSSSATVYSATPDMPLKESSETGNCTNPYGWTKYMGEQILKGVCASDPDFSVVLLRYFNPVGAHPSGLIGEDPRGIPNNLMPYVCQVAVGRREHLTVFGDDYDTPDGTGVRDYIHVVDLAKAHLKAVGYACSRKGCDVFNIGTGKGSSVLDIVKAFEKASGVAIPYIIGPRRPGDLGTVFAETTKSANVLGFRTEYNLDQMCADAYNWQLKNPKGYNG